MEVVDCGINFYMFYYDHVIGYWYSNSSGGRKIIDGGDTY